MSPVERNLRIRLNVFMVNSKFWKTPILSLMAPAAHVGFISSDVGVMTKTLTPSLERAMPSSPTKRPTPAIRWRE